MIKILGQAVLTAILVAVIFLVTGLVGGNQSAQDGVGGSRFPNGLSADGTEPSAGEVRGTTFTATGAVSLSSTLAVTGATTLSSTLTYLEKSTSLSANSSTTNAMSGTTFYINTTGSTTTLPAVATATGTVYRFVIASAIATNDFTINSAEGDNIEGSMIVAGAVVDCDATDKIKFIVDGENLGDAVTLRSDGQKWFVTDSNALTSAKLTCDG